MRRLSVFVAIVGLLLAVVPPASCTDAVAESDSVLPQKQSRSESQTQNKLREFEGRRIRGVSFVTSINLSYRELLSTTGLSTEEKFSSEKLSDAIARLSERDIFSVITPKVTTTADGVILQFVLEPKRYVSEVEFNGNQTIDIKELRRLARIRPGVDLGEVDFGEARRRIIEGYRKEGHFSVEIVERIDQVSISSWVRVVFNIVEGYRSTIDRAILEGVLPDDVSSIPQRLQQDAGGLWASKNTIERLRKEVLLAFRKEGYLEAFVELEGTEIQPLSGDLDVTYRVTVKDPGSIIFQGNTHFAAAELLKPLKMDTRVVPFAPGAIFTLAREIEKFYQRQGYYRVLAAASKLGKIGRRQMFGISIEEGRKYRIRKIRFSGNNAFSDDVLLRTIATREAGFWFTRRWRPGFLVGEQLRADIDSLRSLYASKGYFDALIEHLVEVDQENGLLKLTFEIVEGPQRLIQDIDMQWKGVVAKVGEEGSELAVLPPELLTIKPALQEGQSFNRDILRTEQRRIYEKVIKHGYPNASVEMEGDANRGSVRYVVNPGQRVRIGRVILQGNVLTHDYVLQQELIFESGEIWKLREIERSRQNLASLGYFRAVDIRPLEGALDEAVEDVAVVVRERETGRLEAGAAFTSEDGLHLFGGIGQRNFLGSGHRLLLGLDGYFKSGERLFDAGRARVSYAVPHVWGTKAELSTEAFIQSTVKLIDQFSYDRYGAWTSIGRQLTEKLKGRIGATAYDERLFDVEDDVIIGEDDTGSTFYTFVQAMLDLDYRDNLFNPRSGFRSVLNGSFSSEELGSAVNLYNLTFEQSVLAPVGERLVWANRARFQLVEPFGSTEVVPLGQRIFLGGITSLRGFSKNAIGPRGENASVLGGDRGFNITTELLYDVTERFVGLLFLDAGQAFLSNKGAFIGESLDLSDTRFSPGFGVHLNTPIGPVRAEYGVVLNREFGEGFGRINISVGTAF